MWLDQKGYIYLRYNEGLRQLDFGKARTLVGLP